jgi:hypothetical protein
MEDELVDRIVMGAWRRRRVSRIEAYLFLYEGMEVGPSFRQMWDEANPDRVGKNLYPGARFHSFDQMLRYEGIIDRSSYQALHALERLQAQRRGDHVSVPQVADISVGVEK